jgi:CRP-like cAMP-binding protein
MKTIEIRTSTTPIQPTHTNKKHGVGCPAAARGVLECLLGKTPEQCGFASLAVEPRSALPAAWLSRYSFAVVRRGYLIRQRTDAAGRATSIDAVGPGCCFPLDTSAGSSDDSSTSGYALTPALVCLSDDETIQRGLADGGPGALALHKLHSETTARIERLADARGRPGTVSKVAALLCVLADTLRPVDDPSARVSAEFQQRDLAGLLSIRHESVCRALRAFVQQGLVSRDNTGIVLNDRPRLAML